MTGRKPPASSHRGLSLFERAVAFSGRAVFRSVARVRVEGFRDLPQAGPLIVVANHLSNADPPLVGGWLLPALGRMASFLAKQELFVGPLGPLLLRHGMIMVRPGGSDVDAYRQSRGVLDRGGVVVIFPEGTRSRTGAMIEAKQGVVMLAARSGVQVLPIGVSGTDRFLAPGMRFPRIGTRLTVRAGTPYRIDVPRRPSREQLAAATDEMMGRIAALTEPRHRGRYTRVDADPRTPGP